MGTIRVECSLGYYSVCYIVFIECDKIKVKKNKLFFPSQFFYQTATGSTRIFRLNRRLHVRQVVW